MYSEPAPLSLVLARTRPRIALFRWLEELPFRRWFDCCCWDGGAGATSSGRGGSTPTGGGLGAISVESRSARCPIDIDSRKEPLFV